MEWRVLEWLGMVLRWCWSGLELLGIVLECVRGCWSGVGAAWNMLECVGMVLEWCWSGWERLGIVLEHVRGVEVVLEQPGRC